MVEHRSIAPLIPVWRTACTNARNIWSFTSAEWTLIPIFDASSCTRPRLREACKIAESSTGWKDAVIRDSGMKFAIIADVHANLEAFQAVLGDAEQQRCTHYAFLGDFVGYCADPKACIDIVRSMNAPSVKGKHDEYCSTDLPLDGFNPTAAKAVEWTRKQLTEEDRSWLRNLPYVRTV